MKPEKHFPPTKTACLSFEQNGQSRVPAEKPPGHPTKANAEAAFQSAVERAQTPAVHTYFLRLTCRLFVDAAINLWLFGKTGLTKNEFSSWLIAESLRQSRAVFISG
jgi:hypothetical protein